MLKTICIWFVFFSLTVCYGKNGSDNYNLVYPKNIPVNSYFDISLITSSVFPSAERLELYIIPGEKISIKKIELRSSYKNEILNYSASTLKDFTDPVYKTVINLEDSAFSSGTYFQILMNFNSGSVSRSDVKFYGVFKDSDQVLGLLNSGGNENLENYITADLQFYQPQKSAGKSILFENGSSLNISMQKIQSENLLTEFWIKSNNSRFSFLHISAKNNPDFQYDLSTNNYQMLLVNKGDETINNMNSIFIGRKSWYHIAVDFSFTNHTADFYSNGKLIAEDNIPFFLNASDLIFNFQNNDTDKTFEIDLLRFIDLNNSIEVSSSNENFINFISDSSSVMSQFDFDNSDNLNSGNDKMNISSIGIQYIKSNAPIFTRAPELNLLPLNSAYQLEWSGGDFKQANYYVLQKSVGNSPYTDIYRVQADNDNSKTYSFVDGIDNGNDVVYYRIEQVNNDGGVTYSSSVKVGQGEIQPFVVEQNYPNPFNPTTSIIVDLAINSQLEVTVYNLEGREISRLFKGYLSQGIHTFSFDAANLPSGIYLYKISTPGYSEMKKMILTK